MKYMLLTLNGGTDCVATEDIEKIEFGYPHLIEVTLRDGSKARFSKAEPCYEIPKSMEQTRTFNLLV